MSETSAQLGLSLGPGEHLGGATVAPCSTTAVRAKALPEFFREGLGAVGWGKFS